MTRLEDDSRSGGIPVIVANFEPLRFVVRDQNDSWSPTLDQINANEYDYAKLHRTSTYIDVGIAPYSLVICFDGTLVLPALPQYDDKAAPLSIFNRTLAELLLGGLYCEAVAPDDIGQGWLYRTSYIRTFGAGDGPVARFYMGARTTALGALDRIELLDPETVTVERVREALEAGRTLLKKLGSIPLEQVLYGTTFYVRCQWAESLLHIWITTERIIALVWRKYIVEMSNGTKARRAFLADHRTWSVATKLELLYQKSFVPRKTLAFLDGTRKARNEFAHRGVMPTRQVATEALIGCFQLASLVVSEFKRTDLFSEMVDTVMRRRDPPVRPPPTDLKEMEGGVWLKLPPIPGENEWGDKPFEVIDELRLRAVGPAS